MKNVIFGILASLAFTIGGINLLQAQPNTPKTDTRGYGYGHFNSCGGGYGQHRMNQGHGGRNGWGGHMGQQFMTPDEAMNTRDKILASKNYNECKKIQDQQYATTVKNAKTQGVSLPATPPKAGMCERLSDQGYFGNN